MVRRSTLFMLIMAIFAIPSSILGINELMDFTKSQNNESFACVSGIKENWYKNCKYKFQFDLPTDNWTISDKDNKKIFQANDFIPKDKIVSFSYDYGVNTADAYGFVAVIKLLSLTLDAYEQMFVKLHQEEKETTNITHVRNNNIIKFDYQYLAIHNKTFHCSEIHNTKYKTVYFIRVCENRDGQDADYYRMDIFNFLKSFRYF